MSKSEKYHLINTLKFEKLKLIKALHFCLINDLNNILIIIIFFRSAD